MAQEKITERLVCIWLDEEGKQSKGCIKAQDYLRDIINLFRTFDNTDRCVDFIVTIENTKIFLITSGTLGEIIVPFIHSFEQLDSIYVFCSNKSKHEKWTNDYHKIKGVFNDVKLICDQLKEDTTTQSENDMVAISFVSSADITSRGGNRQDPSFMYAQLLKEILLNDDLEETEEQTKKEMLLFCRNAYAGNPSELKILNEFEEEFFPEHAIYWYTRECFLYKMLNKALWTPEPDILYKLRYFLRHLHRQILSEAALQRDHLSSMVVYRGQTMSSDEIQKIKQNLGGFLSFNNFLSTSLRQEIALKFVWGSGTSVLFEMHIDPTIDKCTFANVEKLSYLQGKHGEHELLFSMGTVFRIGQIEKQKHFYRVQLTLSGDIDEQLALYTMRTREETRSPHSFLSLLKLMHELAQYSSVDRFAEMLRDDASLSANPVILGAAQHAFGLIYLSRGEPKEALDHFRKTLAINLDFLPADHPKLTPIYNNIGSVHFAQSDYETALTFHQLALNCQLNSKNPDMSSIVAYENNIASIYRQQENYPEALVHHKRALELQKRYLGENDPSLTDTYNAISKICYKLGDYEEATSHHERAVALQGDTSQSDPTGLVDCSMTAGTLSLSQGQYQEALNHFNRVLEIQQQYFLPNHPSLAMTNNLIASTYYKQDRFEQALPYYIKALEIEQKSLSNDHPSIAISHFNISTAYVGLLRWSDALESALKAIKQVKKLPQADPSTLASFVHHVGHIYSKQDEYQKALTYYQEALELYRAHLPEDDASMIIIYYRTASAYYQLKRYAEALPFYQKTLDIELKTLPDNAKTIADTYSNLSIAYFGLEQFDQALIAANQAIDQLRKTLPNNHPDVVQQRAYLDAIKMKQILSDIYH